MAKENKELVVASGGSITQARKILNAALVELALPFSGKMKLNPVAVDEAYRNLVEVKSAVEDTLEIAKAKLKAMIENKGEVTTEKGSMERQLGGYMYSMRPTRTGTDPKKLEALLRAKEKDPALYMAATVTYKVDEQKLGVALAKKVLTEEELKNCAYDKSFALQPPTKVEE